MSSLYGILSVPGLGLYESIDGLSFRLRSQLMGRRPDGFTSPHRISAMAVPPSWPEYQFSSSAPTLSIQRETSTLPPEVIVTIVLRLAAEMASISSSCPGGS